MTTTCCSTPTPVKNESTLSALMAPSLGGKKETFNSSSPTCKLKEIGKNMEIGTPEKALLMKKRSGRVIKDIYDVCENHCQSLSAVLSNMCAFSNPEAKTIVNEIVKEVAVKRGVKRTVEDLVGEETLAKYAKSLHVPNWVLLYFKTKARVSSKTWQTVINIKAWKNRVRY